MERFPPELKQYNETYMRKEDLKRETMPFGIPRMMGWCGKGPAELRSMLRTIDCRLQPWRAHLAEYHAGDESRAQVRATGIIGKIPLVILARDPANPTDSFAKAIQKAWDEGQQELRHLSTNSSQVMVNASGHNIQLDRPDVVIAAIHKVVDDSREQAAVANGALEASLCF
jgi:pimeloyl-ACP methyl ester carboxylesterase